MLRSMFRDTLIYTVPMMLSQGLGLILLPIYARVLTRSEFGALDLILAAGPILSVLLTLEIQQGLGRLRIDADDEQRRRMTGTAWLTSLTGYLVFIVIGMLAATAVSDVALHDPGLASTVRLGVLSLTSLALYNLVLNQFRWELRSRTYAWVSSAYTVMMVSITVLLTVVADLGLAGVLVAQCVSGLLGAVVSLVLLRSSWRLTVDWGHLRRMLTFSLPLIPASLSVFVTLYFNRLALGYFGDLSDVASYGMAARLAGLVGLLIVGMQSAVTPLVYAHHRDPGTPKQLAHLFSGTVGLCFLVCLALNAFADDVLVVFAGPDYLSSAPLVALIAPALLMGQLYVFAPGMGIALKTRSQLVVAVAAAVVDIVANVALVPTLGALGGALSAVLSSSVFLGLWVHMSQRYYPMPFERRALTTALGIFALGSALAVLVRNSTEPLAPLALVAKAVLVLACVGLFAWARLFDGVVATLRERPTAAVADPGAPANDRS